MSIPQPTLDDRTYADLLDEARALIPSLAPQWTNHNAADPGITLVELFAWLTEMLIYRVNRLPEENTRAFLRLLNGPQWKPGPDLEDDIRASVLDLRKRHRAVTAEDHEVLAREASPGVARVRCVPRRNLAEQNEADRQIPREGFVSLVIVPKPDQSGAKDPASRPGAPLPSADLITAVRGYLQPRRLVTVRQILVPPIYVPIQAEIVVATRPDVPAGPLRTQVKKAVKGYLDALSGGAGKEGWPFGRDVYVSDLYRLLEKGVAGVDYVPDITLSSAIPSDDPPRCIAGNELWHEEGDQIGIELSAHHLPWVPQNGDPNDPEDPVAIAVAVGSAFLQVRIRIAATADGHFEPAAVRRAVKTAVRLLFHPLHGGPGGPATWEINAEEIEAEVVNLDEITAVASVTIEADPGRLFDDNGSPAVRFEAGEMADVTVAIEI